MTKMSKALTDVVSISGDSKDIKSLLKIMKDNGIKIVSVKCPKKGQTAEEINDFIDKKWKVTKFNVFSNKVLVATKKPSHIYIVYGDRNLTYSLRAFANRFGLDLDHIFVSNSEDCGVIVKELLCEGARAEQIKVSKKFNKKDYGVGMCFANGIES